MQLSVDIAHWIVLLPGELYSSGIGWKSSFHHDLLIFRTVS